MDWQTYTAAGIVIITLVGFLVVLVRPKAKTGCGKGCGCEKTPKT